MKKTILLLLCSLLNLVLAAETVITIGNGTDSQSYPFNLWGGYARSAAVYTSGEIGSSGIITNLAWEVITGDIENCPVRIYLKHTTDADLYATTWDDMISGATLVYNGQTSFPSTGWKIIDIADFVYNTSGGQNLLVLCEANYGGNGASSYPFFPIRTIPDSMNAGNSMKHPRLIPG
jgi:hypothetical protein